MRSLAKKGKTIVCTIHQPSSEIFELFDSLCLLAEGRLAYLGPLAHASLFFAEQGFCVPHNYNPADFFIKQLAIVPAHTHTSHKRVNVSELSSSFYFLTKHPPSPFLRICRKLLKIIDNRFLVQKTETE